MKIIEPTDGEKTDFIWHSNRIDWNTVHPGDLTRDMVHKVVTKATLEPAEIYAHNMALDHVIRMAHHKDVAVLPLIKDVHKILMSAMEPDIAGVTRKCHVYIGTEQMLEWRMVPKYLLRLEEMINAAKVGMDAWVIHNEFECIHPFMDGNGRTGRLLLNYVRLRLDLPLQVVTYGRDGDQYDYYDRIRWYRAHNFKPLGKEIYG